MALSLFARALACLDGRDHVRPEDVVQAWIPVTAHRVHVRDASVRAETILEEIRRGLAVPV
jgi:MoxR-like ATPase